MATTGSQSSVGGQGADNFNIDVGYPLWRHTTRVSQVSRGGSYLWKCNYCQSNKGKSFNSSYYWVKLHFMGPTGKRFAMCKGTSGKGMSNAQIASFVKEQEVIDNLVKRSRLKFINLHLEKTTCNYPMNQLYPPNIHSCKYLYHERKRNK